MRGRTDLFHRTSEGRCALIRRRSALQKCGKCNIAAYGAYALKALNLHQEIFQRFGIGGAYFDKDAAVAGNGMQFFHFLAAGFGLASPNWAGAILSFIALGLAFVAWQSARKGYILPVLE